MTKTIATPEQERELIDWMRADTERFQKATSLNEVEHIGGSSAHNASGDITWLYDVSESVLEAERQMWAAYHAAKVRFGAYEVKP